MDTRLTNLDWSLIQSFLAVAETGSLSGAARRLNASQPTLGRHIKTLEETLGIELFHRHARGFELTRLGHDIQNYARRMEEAMAALALTAAGGETRLAGDVRIATSVFMAHHAMPGIIADIRAQEPDIHIDLVPSDASENLLFREADIAVRMYRPEQLDMVTKHLGDITLGMFATTGYLDRKGRPRAAEDLRLHDMVGYDANDDILREMRAMGIPAARDWFSVRCDNQSAYWELIRAGCGLGFCQRNIALATPGLEEVRVDFPLPVLPVWLTAHESLRHTQRISRVWTLLEAGLRPFVS
ncbi:LysR family transcriptional regulator [Shimia aestuarii]|uniref:Transcriptional regulator, LysR family n=1 Tax=Shimia aestuarii TaxID=254406 RepID=A0A1I4MF90_9RHOB|nr:LysR family transcriptional regulator [Shimia aestuarii]SFM01685.1 transcriptional regulator, LysR family [Shimia aestuarii]